MLGTWPRDIILRGVGEAKPEESLCTLDIAVVVADNHHVVLVPGQ